jgi:hypothetical protein
LSGHDGADHSFLVEVGQSQMDTGTEFEGIGLEFRTETINPGEAKTQPALQIIRNSGR